MRQAIWLCLCVLLIVTQAAAQDICTPVVDRAVERLAMRCEGVARNALCYAYPFADVRFSPEDPARASVPGAQAELSDVDTITVTPDIRIGEWGVVALNIAADLPRPVAGPGIVMTLLGGGTLRNDVPSATAHRNIDPLPVTTLSETTLYAAPSTRAEAVTTVPAATTLLADGINPDIAWLRLVGNEINDATRPILWAQRAQIDEGDVTPSLPLVGTSVRSPMQAFTYQPEPVSAAPCEAARSLLALTTPAGRDAVVTVNGIDMALRGRAVLMPAATPPDVVLVVETGSVRLINGQTLAADDALQLTLDDEGRIIGLSAVRPATDDERRSLLRSREAYTRLAEVNGWAMPDTVVAAPEATASAPDATDETDATLNADFGEGPVVHTVQRGDNLFRIALTYEADLETILRVNDISDPRRIFAGQQIVIPNPGSGFVGRTGAPAAAANTTAANVACEGFRPTSPLSGFGNPQTFYWDPAPEVTRYEVIFYNYYGGRAGSRFTSGAETNLTVFTAPIPTGAEMAWEVVAYRNGEPICRSGRVANVQRAVPPAPPTDQAADESPPPSEPDPAPTNVPPTPIPTPTPTDVPPAPFTASWQCDPANGEIAVTWQNAPMNTVLRLTWTSGGVTQQAVITVNAPTQTYRITNPTFPIDGSLRNINTDELINFDEIASNCSA